jgi:hypothetical protein
MASQCVYASSCVKASFDDITNRYGVHRMQANVGSSLQIFDPFFCEHTQLRQKPWYRSFCQRRPPYISGSCHGSYNKWPSLGRAAVLNRVVCAMTTRECFRSNKYMCTEKQPFQCVWESKSGSSRPDRARSLPPMQVNQPLIAYSSTLKTYAACGTD